MLRERRTLIERLVGETNSIFATLGRRHAELASTVAAVARLLSITGSRTREITDLSHMPGTALPALTQLSIRDRR